jgi:hypothetical protein
MKHGWTMVPEATGSLVVGFIQAIGRIYCRKRRANSATHFQCHGPVTVIFAGIPVRERDFPLFHSCQPVVGDGDPVGVMFASATDEIDHSGFAGK